VRVTVAGLNRAIGLDVSAPTEVVDRKEEPPVSQTLEDALGLALANRREIAVVRKGIADAELDVKIARADYLPTLSIQSAVSNVTGTGVQNADVLGGGTFATLDVYTGGERRGQWRAAQAGVWRAAAQAKQVVDGVAYEVHYAHTAVDDARERVAQARTTVAQARENLRLVAATARSFSATATRRGYCCSRRSRVACSKANMASATERLARASPNSLSAGTRSSSARTCPVRTWSCSSTWTRVTSPSTWAARFTMCDSTNASLVIDRVKR
jgi:hypothetical protein